MTRAGVAIFACLVAAPASANVWQQAIERKEPDLAQVRYEDTMRQGDDALELATASDLTEEQEAKWVQRAVDEYRQAAKARPDSAEPWFRIADALYYAYLDDSVPPTGSALHRIETNGFDRAHGLETVTAWNEAEKRAPLDPHFAAKVLVNSLDVLFERAILETRAVDGASPDETQRLLRTAAADYQKILARSDVLFVESDEYETTLGNLAETYMMLGELDKSIETYRLAYRRRSQSSTAYGLAVALDRADEGSAAKDLITQEGEYARTEFKTAVDLNHVFFVPEGEVYYYRALIGEAFGEDEEAILMWQKYIKSGAHPDYQPRARQHLAALLAHKPKPVDFDDER